MHHPVVSLSKGAPCGRHCFHLDVSLSDFPAGLHQVDCWSGRAGLFATYATSASESSQCTYDRTRDVVWVTVDGFYRSNTVQW